MLLILALSCLAVLAGNSCDTVTSPQIRILDVATKESETRVIPHRVSYRNSFRPGLQPFNRHEETPPLKSYVIYDDYPVKIFKEWKANFPGEFPPSGFQSFPETKRQPGGDFPPEYHLQNGRRGLPPPKPTLAYRSVYSNVIKVYDNSLDDLDRSRFQSERYVRPYEGGVWKAFQPPVDYEPIYTEELSRRKPFQSQKLPENFPRVFSPNDKFHFSSFGGEVPKPPRFFYPQEGFYDTYTVNYNQGNKGHRDEVEILPEAALGQKNQKKSFLCGFIRVNQRQFPENGGPCGRSEDDLPLVSPEYPNYYDLPSDKIPVEHRRQHFQMKRIKRSASNESEEGRGKREAAFGYGYSSWGSPFSYDGGYYGENYPSQSGYGGYGSNYGSYYRSNNRNRNQGYRNRYYGGSRSNYDEYDDEYQSNDDSNSRGLMGYLTNGGRRYKNRNNNNNNEDDDDDNDNNRGDDDDNDNRNEDSDEEMERQNSNRRDANDRRRNRDNSRDRRRNNNNNNNNSNDNNNGYNDDDDDYRDNRRNNNRQNNNYNNRRNNNYNRNNNNNNRYGYNNRMRYDNGYNNHGYGNSYGSNGYNGYGGSYGSYGGNGGYGSGYGSSGGYGYGGGYGNGFSSF